MPRCEEKGAAPVCAMVVTGHGGYASGLLGAMELIMGAQPRSVAVDFPGSDSVVQLREKLTAAVARFGDGPVAVLCDLRGGSPFNVAQALARERDDLEVVFGANLPLLIELVARREDAGSVEALVESAVGSGSRGVDRFVPPAAGQDADEGEWS